MYIIKICIPIMCPYVAFLSIFSPFSPGMEKDRIKHFKKYFYFNSDTYVYLLSVFITP